jgi:hypothetical protein
MRRLVLTCALLLLAGVAGAQSFSQRGYSRVIDENDVLLTPRISLKCGTGLTCSDDVGNERTVIAVIGGGGGGTTGMIGAGTCTPVTGGVGTLFMSSGTCVEQTEDDAAERVKNAMVFSQLACIASADIGAGKTVTVTGRVGACGSLASSSMICTLTGGVSLPVCDSGANTLSASAGQCWSLQVVPSTTLTNNAQINCTMERTT